MTLMGIILLASAVLSWLALHHCPLAKAIGRQIDQVAASSR